MIKKRPADTANRPTIGNQAVNRHPWRRLAAVFLAFLCVLALAVFWIDLKVERVGQRLTVSMNQLEPADCIIVPGALVYGNETPSPILMDRLDVALLVYQEGMADRILVSGDHGSPDYDEVNVMRQYLIKNGVLPEHVFMDHAGFDTYDTLFRARDVFLVQKAIVVTQTFHLNRALYIGDKLGLDIQGVASDLRPYGRSVYYRQREYLARFKAFLDCVVLESEPVYLGPPIPISGNGLATVDRAD